MIGGTFAANLSRVGEKDNYDYLVRWVHNPRERTRPYSPFEKRDLGPEDYAKHNLPFVFDLDHSRSPDDGHELVVQQPTVMPNLRLSDDDARDVASYLITLKHADAHYDPADFMDDPKLKDKGKALVQFYGCAGCHEIATLEDEGRVGTELTNEGSKPIERLDFAMLIEDAKNGVQPDGKRSARGSWYDLKGFFDHKLADPAVYDTGKYKPSSLDRLRMPKPNVTPTDIDALTTMLLGSTDPSLPPEYMYKPSDERASIQKGWWIVTKYNCMGCHQIDIGQRSVLMDLPMYQGENKINLPPVLTSEGARVNPEWLKDFLANPALSTTDTNRDGVRSYLQVRMPTFSFSDDEIRSLVLFFGAISHQAEPFIPQKFEPLTTAEVRAWRASSVHQHRGSVPEVPCHRRSGARQDRHRAQLPAGQGPPASGLDRAVDNQSGADYSRHGHAVGPVPPGQRPLGVLGPNSGKHEQLHGRPCRPSGSLYVPIDPGRAALACRALFGRQPRLDAKSDCRQPKARPLA